MDKPFDITEEQNRQSILIAGGGISGLYCARELARRGHSVIVTELSDQWGGRIETSKLDGFIAEFGPMRFEPDLQPRFKQLVDSLKIELEPFTGPFAEAIEFPKYNLPEEERGPVNNPYNALELLKRGVLRIMGRNGNPRDPREQAWMDDQTEANYDEFRNSAKLGDQFLWEMGFWNALSSDGVLSHQALMKIRDTGTFYHMLSDNLNAVEWTIWWLRALKTAGENLRSIQGGSVELIDRLVAEFEENPNINLVPNCRLLGFDPVLNQGVIATCLLDGKNIKVHARRLILAMPQAPLKELSRSLPERITKLLDTVNGFPMVKVFFVTKEPFWDSNTPPQTRASEMPTREVHYFYRPSDKHGMALVYTDRPATEYWNLYITKPDQHDRAEIDSNEELKNQFARFLAKELKRALISPDTDKHALKLTVAAQQSFKGLSEAACAKKIADSVVTYGIRDWERSPYGAANHSWRPGIQSRRVQNLLKAFPLTGSRLANVHICGEAFSDYSGFIEGALNSAHLVIDAIDAAD